MRIAYLIVAHEYPQLLARVVSRLQGPRSSVFVHLDRRIRSAPFKRALENTDVRWVRRVRSSWGTFGQVRASLLLLREALATDPQASTFALLSGVDYPLRSGEELARFFDARPGVSFISCHRLPWDAWGEDGGLDRLTHWHFSSPHSPRTYVEYPATAPSGRRPVRTAHRLCAMTLPRTRSLPCDVTLYGGSSWWNLTRDACETILGRIRSSPGFLRRFWFTRSADEIFYQTLVMNSNAGKIESDDLRCAFWDGRRGQHPATVTVDDFQEIEASGKLFVRKVHPQHSDALLDKIDRELLRA